MPLDFDERGLLPPGVHDATIEELDDHFGRFQRTDQRITLCKKLKAYITALKTSGIKCSLIIDGSFIAESLVQKGFRLKMLREEEVNLEDVFMGITKGITN